MSYMKREFERLQEEGLLHECYFCDSSFVEMLDLIAHIRENHNENN